MSDSQYSTHELNHSPPFAKVWGMTKGAVSAILTMPLGVNIPSWTQEDRGILSP